MVSNSYFSIASLLYCMLLLFIYFSKKRVNSNETKLYGFLVISNAFTVIFAIMTTITICFFNNYEFLVEFISKTLLVCYDFWIIIFSFYVFSISNVLLKDSWKKIMALALLITSYIIYILPLNYFYESNTVYTFGPAANFVYILVGLCIVLWIVILFKNIKNFKNKKFYPVMFLIILLLLSIVIQKIFPGLLLITYTECFITLFMYFTIENPDVKMMEQVNEAKARADRANNAKTEFLSSMSHEIRTPLNAIVGFSNSLLEENINSEAKSDIENIIMASDSLLDIVNGILDISKIEANKLEIVKVNYSFPKIFNDLVMLTKARMGEKPLEFNYSYDKNIPEYLYGDVTRVKQVILNLLTNAVKYTNTGSINFRVDCETFENSVKLNIIVKDTGIGVKKENLDKLFTKFDRLGVEKDTTVEGTGLGLAITKKLVNLMGGKIIVESEYGKGSTFTITLSQKIVKGADLKELLDQKKEEEHNDIIDARNKKVLVVDDNKLNLKVAEKLLSKYNVCLELVDSGKECIRKVSETKYDLILLDDMMPKMSGTETLKELKKISDFSTPVVALTANAISGMREKYLSDGFDDYLSKPIEKLELNRIIKKYLG